MSIIDDVRKTHDDLLDAIKGLRVSDLQHPATIGDWSIRDVLLHMVMWDGEVLKNLAIWRAGHKVDWSYVKDEKAILRFNDFWLANMKHLSMKKVLQMLNAIHAAIIADLAAADAGKGKKRRAVPRWVWQITVDHNNRHIRKLRTYRKTLGR